MDIAKKIEEIDELFENGWFSEVISKCENVSKLPIEEQINWIMNRSIHGQTTFIRDNILFPVLEHIVIPSFNSNPIKIASVGCSDGREVYSILIYNWKIKEKLILHGYDSNPDFIDEARAEGGGIKITPRNVRISSAYSERYSNLDKWEKYGAENEAYRIGPNKEFSAWADLTFTPQAKNHVKFNVHNILTSPLPEIYDVIVMSNVLCHYTPKGRDKILGNIEKSLANDGWLICERYDPGSENAKEEYDKYMKNLSKKGFQKKRTIIPTDWKENDNVSCWSRVYKKKR